MHRIKNELIANYKSYCLSWQFSFFAFMTIFVFTLFLSNHSYAQKTLHTDISIVTIDLKYNQRQGVKICEVQPLSVSFIDGYSFANGKTGVLEEKFCQIIQQYFDKNASLFFGDTIADRQLKKAMIQNGWRSVLDTDVTSEYLELNPSFKDISHLKNYTGAVYRRPLKKSKINFLEKNLVTLSSERFSEFYPHLLLLDSAIFPYIGDKYLFHQLLSSNTVSDQLRPKSNSYAKIYNPELANQIAQDIGGDVFVVKPRALAMGRGVFIVHKEDLDSLLQTLLLNTKSDLKSLKDPSKWPYFYWYRDKKETFLVEEFIPSDPVSVPHLKHEKYDGTMRVVAVLTYDHPRMRIHFLGGYWKLPRYPLSATVDLAKKHKSYGRQPYFAKVDLSILKQVENQLEKGIKIIYANMLGIE